MRVWIFAILMMLLALGAGHVAWTSRADGLRLGAAYAACTGQLEPAIEKARQAARRAQGCELDLVDVSAQGDVKDARLASVQGSLTATEEELQTLRAQRAEAEKRLEAIARIQAQFAKMTDTGQLKVSSRRGNLVVELPAEVLFRSGSADLSERGQLSVLEVGFILKQFPDRRFLVVGHTDNVPLKTRTFVDNWQLSTARALTVTHVLVKAGMKPQMLLAAGAGEHDPLRSNAKPADRQRNRRIEIQLLPAIADLPPLPSTLRDEKSEAPRA